MFIQHNTINKRTLDEAKAHTKHQGQIYNDDDDPNDALLLLPFGIQAEIMAIPKESERALAVNTYLNGRLRLLPPARQQAIMAMPSMAAKINQLLHETNEMNKEEEEEEDEDAWMNM